MLAYDNKDIPAKMDQAPGSSCSGSSNEQDMKPTPTGWASFSNNIRKFNWRNQRVHATAVPFDFWPFFWIMFFTMLALITGIVAVSTNYWVWSPPTPPKHVGYFNSTMNETWINRNDSAHWGLWDSCRVPVVNQNFTSVETTTAGSTIVVVEKTKQYSTPQQVECVQHHIYHSWMQIVSRSYFSYMQAAQGLIITALIFFFISLITLMYAYRFADQTNLNHVRNWYLASIFIQVAAFWMMIIGVFFYVFTVYHIMAGPMVMFFYFLLSFFVGIIAFLVVEFKAYKLKHARITTTA